MKIHKNSDRPVPARDDRKANRDERKDMRVNETETVRQQKEWRDDKRENGWPDE
jgi:hypothetical protein